MLKALPESVRLIVEALGLEPVAVLFLRLNFKVRPFFEKK